MTCSDPLVTAQGLPARRWPEPLARARRALHGFLTEVGENAPVLLAVSGGADSMALAVAAATLPRRTHRLGAVVIDHGIQPITAQVATDTAAALATFDLDPVIVRTLQSPPTETAAREARYAVLTELAEQYGAHIATAHTADDQAEQVLLGLARGSGPRSLAGIPPRRPLGAGHLIRPLLGLTRAETEAICTWANITWWEDPMNTDRSTSRARVRYDLLPRLADPEAGLGAGVRSGLVQTAQIAAEDADYLESVAADTLAKLPYPYPLAQLQRLHPAILHRVLSLMVTQRGAPTPTRERILALADLVRATSGSSAGPIQVEGHVVAYRDGARGTMMLKETPRPERPA